jgi:hypothetical protein
MMNLIRLGPYIRDFVNLGRSSRFARTEQRAGGENMRRHHTARVAKVAAALLSGLVLAALVTSPAVAHDHPTQAELAAPAVVFIKTFARVDISLIEHNRAGQHIGLVQRTYQPEIASGSGFAVDPNGTVVTAGGVVTPDLNRARIYAVNKVFNERYGRNAPMPKDQFGRQRIKDLAGDPINVRLQRCYQPNTTDNTGGCLMTVSRVVKVYPWVSAQNKFGELAADVLSPAEGKTQDVAVLRVGASSMPTVPLGQTAGTSKAFTVLGFTGVPTAKSSSQAQLIGHFVNGGGLPFDQDEYLPKLKQGIASGARGGPLVAADTGQAVGLLSAPADTTRPAAASAEPSFVDAKRIREVVTSVGVQPRRGPADAVFEDAMHSFKNKLYTPPIPSFQRTLELYPGHALATEYLATSKAKAGSEEDLTGKGGGGLADASDDGAGLPGWVMLVLGVVVVAFVLATVILALVRRRRREEEDDDAGEPPLPVVPAGLTASAGSGRPGAPPRPSPPGPKGTAGGGTSGPGQGGRPPVVVLPESSESSSSAARAQAGPKSQAGVRSPDARAAGPGAGPGAAKGSLAATVFCTNCGKNLGPQHRFCGFCGTPVE